MSIAYMCADHASTFTISSTSGEQTYMVKFFLSERPMCTCPAYRFSGPYDEQTCKHIKTIIEHGCFNGRGRRDLERFGVQRFSTTTKNVTDEHCPGCSQPMIEMYI